LRHGNAVGAHQGHGHENVESGTGAGVDPEYAFYRDGDNDGMVCE
jgi:hypothetical protein